MTSQSIYTECVNLSPDHVAWLDGCGAKWRGIGRKLSEYKPVEEYIYLANRNGINCFMQGLEDKDYTHTPTGSEFCERVAEILGIEKPVFGDKPEVEGKGLAIEVSQLREEDIETLVEMCGESWAEVPKQALKNKNERYLFYKEGGLDCHHKMGLKNLGVTITESVPEFMRYVADKTGKKWEGVVSGSAPNEATKEALLKVGKIPMNPAHKTYRVLDSLDGVPFDTRIPLSEWIPPFGEEVAVIHSRGNMFAELESLDKEGLMFQNEHDKYLVLDGHWMRIV